VDSATQWQQGYERVGAVTNDEDSKLTIQILEVKWNGTVDYNVTVFLDDQSRPSIASAKPHRWVAQKRMKERRRTRGAARRVEDLHSAQAGNTNFRHHIKRYFPLPHN
jgi:hypothetical protein